MGFELDDRLARDSVILGGLAFSELRMMDDARWPWLLLVPRRDGLAEWHELEAGEAGVLAAEIAVVSAALKEASACTKVNVGALGNIVRQMHVHLVARSEDDPAWPGPVWGHGVREPWAESARETFLRALFAALGRRGVALAVGRQ